MSKYEMIIYWSEDNNTYVVEVPELPGCMADGPTCVDAVQAAEKFIQEWIDTTRELGRPISKPHGRRLMYA